MAVNVQAQGGGGITAGGNLSLGQIGSNSPASWAGVLMVGLLVVIILVALNLR